MFFKSRNDKNMISSKINMNNDIREKLWWGCLGKWQNLEIDKFLIQEKGSYEKLKKQIVTRWEPQKLGRNHTIG
jgi:hypothetical protein